MIHCKECGMPRGTRVEVSHLFNSVPGRRKFLKTESTETTHLVHMSKLYALAHPKVTFTLIESGRTLFRSPACEKSADRVREIFGKGLANSLEPLKAQENDFFLNGLIGKPGESRSTRKEMIFFVNRRPVDSRTLSYAVIEAFHTYVPKGRFPAVILFLEVDPAIVDVNVHPAKREVRFRDEPKVRSFILGAVAGRNRELASSGGQHLSQEKKIEYEQENGQMVPKIEPQALEIYGLKGSLASEKKDSPEKSPSLDSSNPSVSESCNAPIQASEVDAKSPGSSELFDKKWVGYADEGNAEWRLLGRPYSNLAVFSTPHGMVALHVRAAYERVRLEQLENALRDPAQQGSQALLIPEPVECDGIDLKNLKANLESLGELGFRLEEFGRNFYRLESCPTWIEPGNAVSYINDFLELAREGGVGVPLESIAREALENQVNYAHENREEFSDVEIIQIANDLLTCRNPYVCPKGRPTYFEIPKRDFETRFKRKI